MFPQLYLEYSSMRYSNTNHKREITRTPLCQATGCFSPADVYVVIKETDVPNYYEVKNDSDYELKQKLIRVKKAKHQRQEDEDLEFDGFKLILYLCGRHDNEFKYLVKGSELRVAKRCNLRMPQLR